jgi:Domain of unknown function (DUF1943)
MLTPKVYGLHKSRNFFRSYMVKEMGLGYKQQLAYIGSEDSIIPNSLFYTIRRNLGGFKRQTLAVSNFIKTLYGDANLKGYSAAWCHGFQH